MASSLKRDTALLRFSKEGSGAVFWLTSGWVAGRATWRLGEVRPATTPVKV